MPLKIHEEVLCGYRKCCPTVEIFDDGSMLIRDDDPAIGSVGTVKLDPEAVARIVELAAKKKE